MLLAVLFCTSAMCICDVYAENTTSLNAHTTKKETNQNSISNEKPSALNSVQSAYSDEEVYLLAQLVHHEAHNQSYNGKVAIAEVVLNRVNSSLFPNEVSSVIFQGGQFTSKRRLKNVNPTDQELRIANSVLNGNLRTFNDNDILYFRNPKITSGIAASIDKNWGSLDYETYIGDHAFYSQDTNVSVADNNIKPKDKKTSIFDKIPSAISITKFFTPKVNKTEQVAEATANSEGDVNVTKDATDENDVNTIQDVTNENTALIAEVAIAAADDAEVVEASDADNLTEEDAAFENAKRLEEALSARYYAMLAEKTMELENGIEASSKDLVNDDNNSNSDDDEETLELINVENEIYMAQAQALALSIQKKDEDTEEEYDKNDPVAVARYQAMLNEKVEREQREKLLEEERLATERAKKQAVMLDQMQVEKVARENEEIARATKAAVDYAVKQQTTNTGKK